MNYWKHREAYNLAIAAILVAGAVTYIYVDGRMRERAVTSEPPVVAAEKAIDPVSEKLVADTVNYIGTVTDAITPSIRPMLDIYNEAQAKQIAAGEAASLNAVPPEKQLAAALRSGCAAAAVGETDKMLALVKKTAVSAEKFPVTTKKLEDAVARYHAFCGELAKATKDGEAVKLYGEQYLPYLGALRNLKISLESELGNVVMNLPTDADLSEILRGLLVVPNV